MNLQGIRKAVSELHQDESGQSFITMLLVLLPLLLLILGVTHDLGNAAAGVTIAQNAADLGAHEAAKLVDVTYFTDRKSTRLNSSHYS